MKRKKPGKKNSVAVKKHKNGNNKMVQKDRVTAFLAFIMLLERMA